MYRKERYPDVFAFLFFEYTYRLSAKKSALGTIPPKEFKEIFNTMKKPSISCSWEKKHNKEKKLGTQNKTRLYKYKGNFTWQGIKTEKYKPNARGWADIVRQTLIGYHGETTKFHLRYFEIAPNGYSSFEMHKHEHVVIG